MEAITINLEDFGKIHELTADDFIDAGADFYPVISPNEEFTTTATLYGDAWGKILGCDQAMSMDSSFTLDFKKPYQVQKRTHKKRRINKKWAKRYGYVTKFDDIRLTECTIIPSDNDKMGIICDGNGNFFD